MKQSIQLRMGQSLTMTPQLQQAIRLLQLSSLELSAEIQEALDSNLMLELVDENDRERSEAVNNAGDTDAQISGSENGTATTAENLESLWQASGGGDDLADAAAAADADTAFNADDSEPSFTAATESGADTSADADMPEVDGARESLPDDLPVDTVWDDIFDTALPRPASGSGDDEDSSFENQRGQRESLQQHLLWQLNLVPMSERDRQIALAIIDAINDDGYLCAELPELCEAKLQAADNAEVTEPEEVLAVLRQVQQFDPPGVAARNVAESLTIQLRQMPVDSPWRSEALELVQQHLALLAARDYNLLLRRLKLAREELAAVIAVIKRCNPRPGSQFEAQEVEYIEPDVVVSKKHGAWKVELNHEAMPNLRINRRYAAMIRRADASIDNTTLRAHLQEARWFIKSLQSRGETLLKVATAIVQRQRAFLEHGAEAMKPLVLADIADALEMHESTISRVTTRKYMHTPRGIFELKYFFSSHVGTVSGGEASSTAIRAVIKKLIEAEPAGKPLSDSTLAKILCDQGVNVARRTVAKYREAMGIQPSHERKTLS